MREGEREVKHWHTHTVTKGWRERGKIVTLQHRFSTHTYFEFDYIITAHMSLQKGMGSRGAYTHTQSKGAFLTCVLSRYDVPVQRKLLKPGQGARRRYQLCLPLPVWVYSKSHNYH